MLRNRRGASFRLELNSCEIKLRRRQIPFDFETKEVRNGNPHPEMEKSTSKDKAKMMSFTQPCFPKQAAPRACVHFHLRSKAFSLNPYWDQRLCLGPDLCVICLG